MMNSLYKKYAKTGVNKYILVETFLLSATYNKLAEALKNRIDFAVDPTQLWVRR